MQIFMPYWGSLTLLKWVFQTATAYGFPFTSAGNGNFAEMPSVYKYFVLAA